MKRRVLSVMLALAMTAGLAACGGAKGTTTETKTEEKQEEAKTEEKSEEKQEEAKTDITKMTADEIKAAMKEEPAYGQKLCAEYDGGDCTSGPSMAKQLGYFDAWGLDVEIVSGTEITEAVGTNKAQFGVHHIAHMLVPITNGVKMVFTGAAQTGCKSLYVKADSGYTSMKDMVGKNVGIDGPIGSSAHNMVIRFCIADGVDKDKITYQQIEQSACVQALQNGEVDAVMLSDRYAKKFIDDGSLKSLRSITFDDDFKDETCCVMAMNAEFVEKNPITAQVLTQCVMDAYMFVDKHPEEAAKIMLDNKMVSGTEELTLYMYSIQNFAQDYAGTEKTIKKVAEDYIKEGIITSKWTVDKVMEAAWMPLGEKGTFSLNDYK